MSEEQTTVESLGPQQELVPHYALKPYDLSIRPIFEQRNILTASKKNCHASGFHNIPTSHFEQSIQSHRLHRNPRLGLAIGSHLVVAEVQTHSGNINIVPCHSHKGAHGHYQDPCTSEREFPMAKYEERCSSIRYSLSRLPAHKIRDQENRGIVVSVTYFVATMEGSLVGLHNGFANLLRAYHYLRCCRPLF